MKKIIILFMLILGACTHSPAPTPTIVPTESLEQVEFIVDDMTIALMQPAGWEIYVQSESHLIMAEGNDPFQSTGRLEGMLVNMWVPTLGEVSAGYELDKHSIAEVLNQVLGAYETHNNMAIHEPTSFDWAGHDAAYYTLTDQHGNLSLIIALKVAEQHFIAVNVSAPDGHEERIRTALPMIFDLFMINGARLDNTALNGLPSPLAFPAFGAINTRNSKRSTPHDSRRQSTES